MATAASLRQEAYRQTIAGWREWADWVLAPETGESWEQIECGELAELVRGWRWGRTMPDQAASLARLLEQVNFSSVSGDRLRWIKGETRKLLALYPVAAVAGSGAIEAAKPDAAPPAPSGVEREG
jgi:hypothetical protein